MTILTNIVAPGNILITSNTATITNKTINGADNTLTVRMANDVSGTLPTTNGGFGQTSYTEGQLLIGNTAGSLTKTTLTAGTDISVTNGNGTITIDYAPPIIYINSAWTWGAGGNGARGDNATGCVSSPVSVVGGFTDWCQIFVGGFGGASAGHGHAIRTNGTLWSWGYWGRGVLGNNGTYGVGSSSPVSVTGGFTDWCQVTANRFNTSFAAAVRQNGTAWAWACNNYGQLGDNTTTNRFSPVSVVGGFTNWCQVSAGDKHLLGVRTNGTLYAWGKASAGQLGNNEQVDKSSPVSVVGGFTDWCQVSAGTNNSIAVRQNGTLWGWGANGSGRLGDGTTSDRSSPVSVVGGFTDWCQVSAYYSSLAVRTNGTLWAWGYNTKGQLGDNTTVSKSSPVSVVGGFTDWCQVAASGASLAVRQNGTAWAWGLNNAGQLGDNTTVSKSSPISVIGGFTDWCQVSTGYGLSAGIRSTAT
jgi:alpha-tubulin suppressor-like RCC1 family protein